MNASYGGLGGLALLALATGACAHSPASEASAITIERPIVLAVDEAGGEVAAYAVFVNVGPATQIIDAQCACAERLELHLVERGRGMITDWPLVLPANSRTAIEPPGVPRHLMLVEMTKPIALGEKVTLRFRLETGEWIEEGFKGVADSAEAWASLAAAEGE